MSTAYDKVRACYQELRKKTDFQPRVGIVLGSGLGDFANEIKIVDEVNYKDIPGFPVSTVPGHDGKFIFGYVDETPVVCMKGRVHYYEGYEMSDVVLPTRLMALMGIETLFLSNAAGGMGDGFGAGQLMLITDHISCFVPSPLIGPNDDEFGTRFPDMSNVYNKELCELIKKEARALDIDLKQGVYCQLTGPCYETPAEIRMIKGFGASAVGMSTVVEAIVANHMGVKVCGVSCISNLAAGISLNPLSHKEVQEAADAVAPQFKALVKSVVAKL